MKDKLKEIIKNSLSTCGYEVNENYIIERTKDNNHGDYACNVAMQLTKQLKKNPRIIAEEIVSNINDERIDKIEIAGPGFINFYLKKDYLFDNINTILKEKDSYGSSKIGNNKKINIEFVSANPTGILHLGHARGASYGDSLSRLLSFTGYDVTREYYINDAGNQVNNLALSIEARYNEVCKRTSVMPEDGYYGKEIIEIAKSIMNEKGTNITDFNYFKEVGLKYLLDQIKEDLKKFRVSFDIWTSEKSIYESGKVANTLNHLKESGRTYETDNALWLKTAEYGDEKDRVLIKADGSYTYLLPDIAYHVDKYSRGYDKLIDVLGADHHGYIPRLKAAMIMMGENPNKLEAKILQMVRLVRGSEEIKMSKRTGNAVTIQDLVEEVGLDATRYFFSARSLDTQMDFDMELATKKSNENPVYYIEYAHARICSILREYNRDIKQVSKYVTLNSQSAYNLLTKLYEFRDIVEVSALKMTPHTITSYVYDLASVFHAYYASEKILTTDEVATNERLNLITAVGITIKNALNLIGVQALDKM